ncbi:uncharacterized protein MONOS_2702 [Monocercomonoides exilis]|uniref:uncharacterized protein n=1 Tax=Monocercomonoides exilis TaxID=2049356 RepID=UPI0035597A7E|nr:hypothetical protein MONOS_2702 [Monocercomonoides exilis]|eukprot:MONOS_2702.1-p1 / transcript=MONOS_2702.1 / gene=MONOS_2702 / organism=Monocercomonoides_exilis_PA203 / gene_product=unspecified product / transcript_product=unspecified product / location=Mono_scaffold00057:29273-30276(+) / protein_length=314 / sequence_SO=supercontig / SO=protein_coding / is_pseudo=false
MLPTDQPLHQSMNVQIKQSSNVLREVIYDIRASCVRTKFATSESWKNIQQQLDVMQSRWKLFTQADGDEENEHETLIPPQYRQLLLHPAIIPERNPADLPELFSSKLLLEMEENERELKPLVQKMLSTDSFHDASQPPPALKLPSDEELNNTQQISSKSTLSESNGDIAMNDFIAMHRAHQLQQVFEEHNKALEEALSVIEEIASDDFSEDEDDEGTDISISQEETGNHKHLSSIRTSNQPSLASRKDTISERSKRDYLLSITSGRAFKNMKASVQLPQQNLSQNSALPLQSTNVIAPSTTRPFPRSPDSTFQ